MSVKRIERDGGTRFQVYGRANGVKVYVGTYDSERAAKAAEEDHRVTQRKIERGEIAPEADQKRTLAEAATEWLASMKAQGSRSHEIYKRRMEQAILPTLGSVPLVRVTPGNIIRWRDNYAHEVAPPTVNTTLGTLSAAFEWFITMQWCSENPVAGVKRLEETPHAFEWLRNADQITRLLAACPENIRPIVALMVGTGMRIDEVLHLEWDDIDLDHRLISVRRGRQGTTKSGKERPVPIFNSVLPLLRELRLRRGDNVLVFPGQRDPVTKETRARSKPGVSVPFKAALIKAGLPKRIRPHDCRHTFAILYLLDGGDLHRLSRILGHSTVVTTERCYLRFKPTGFDLDYGRVAFRIPSESPVAQLRAS